MKNLLLFMASIILTISLVSAQKTNAGYQHRVMPFEGTITFIQCNGVDTSYYKYYVKGNEIKIDNTDASGRNIEGSFLINTTTRKTTAISPVRHIYFNQPSGSPIKSDGAPKVSKTGKVRKLNGYLCHEWVVTDAQEGIKIYYWLAYGHFDFFDDMLKVLNRKDQFSEYYLEIPHTKGMFPMLAVEEDLAGNKKGAMKAGKVLKVLLKDSIFSIPAGYKEFNR